MGKKVSSPLKLIVRCFLQQTDDGQWQAFSLEFGLAVQADSMKEVRHKLDNMIQTYLHDALVGEDREHAYDLLARRAAPSIYFRYFLGMVIAKLRGYRQSSIKPFVEPWGLEPKHCGA